MRSVKEINDIFDYNKYNFLSYLICTLGGLLKEGPKDLLLVKSECISIGAAAVWSGVNLNGGDRALFCKDPREYLGQYFAGYWSAVLLTCIQDGLLLSLPHYFLTPGAEDFQILELPESLTEYEDIAYLQYKNEGEDNV